MFKCKICLEKDKQILSLQSEVKYLRELANPAKLTVQIPYSHNEMNQILGGSAAEQPMMTPEEEEIESEATRLLNGTY